MSFSNASKIGLCLLLAVAGCKRAPEPPPTAAVSEPEAAKATVPMSSRRNTNLSIGIAKRSFSKRKLRCVYRGGAQAAEKPAQPEVSEGRKV